MLIQQSKVYLTNLQIQIATHAQVSQGIQWRPSTAQQQQWTQAHSDEVCSVLTVINHSLCCAISNCLSWRRCKKKNARIIAKSQNHFVSWKRQSRRLSQSTVLLLHCDYKISSTCCSLKGRETGGWAQGFPQGYEETIQWEKRRQLNL